jgi:hypothetical protein
MHALAGPYLAAAVLLVVAGGSKLRDPLPLVRALRSARLPGTATLVRVLATAEVVLGTVAVVTGSRLSALLLCLSYAAFTAFVLLARSVGGVLASCGCFGRADTPPTAVHVLVTAAFAATAAAVAVRPLGALPDVLVAGPAAGIPLLLATAAVAATAYLSLALLPALLATPRAAA